MIVIDTTVWIEFLRGTQSAFDSHLTDLTQAAAGSDLSPAGTLGSALEGAGPSAPLRWSHASTWGTAVLGAETRALQSLGCR